MSWRGIAEACCDSLALMGLCLGKVAGVVASLVRESATPQVADTAELFAISRSPGSLDTVVFNNRLRM